MQCPKCGKAMRYSKYSWHCDADDVCLDKSGILLNRFDPNYLANVHVLAPEERSRVTAAYRALYLGGFDNVHREHYWICDSYIHLLDDSIHVLFDLKGPVRIYVSYRIVEELNVTTAWRTVGPITAALSFLLSKPSMLNVGFRDNLGILHTLHLKMNESDTDECYDKIKSKLIPLKNICKKCQKPLRESTKFCGECGEPIPTDFCVIEMEEA
jgi:hypothetical protein